MSKHAVDTPQRSLRDRAAASQDARATAPWPRRLWAWQSVVLLVLFLLVGCTNPWAEEPPPLTPVTLQLNWVHSPEFAGYYVADAMGYYAEEGLNVTFVEQTPGAEVAPRDVLANGDADFAVQGVNDIIRLAEDGHRPLALTAYFQISPRVFFSLTEDQIERPQDMVGKRVGIKSEGWRRSVHDVLARVGVDPAEIIELDVEFDAMTELLLSDEVDVWTGFVNDEVVEIRHEGHEVNLIFPSDYAVGTYIGLVVTMEDRYLADPDLAARFVRASTRGWEQAIQNPDATAAVLTQWAPNHEQAFHRDSVLALTPLIDTGQTPIGWIDAQRWARELGDAYNAATPLFTTTPLRTLPTVQSWLDERNADVFGSSTNRE